MINHLRDIFFSLKLNKYPEYNQISFNIVKKCFRELSELLKDVFSLSIETGVFADKLKITCVSPLYRAGNSSSGITNYRPASALPCFSKILETIMYNRLFPYVSQEETSYSKQFIFQSGHSKFSFQHGNSWIIWK